MNYDIEEMKDGKDKELLKLINDGGKPYVKKHDGYAVKVEEDKEITYRDYDDQENVLKVPAGSYVIDNGHGCPSVVTAEEFEKNNKFVDGDKKEKSEKKSDDGPKIGIESLETE